ncbi:hypothetical protein GGH15_002409 [Coemansia sp. RSA 562]|nr:hypothetical protein GGH15_002409 [Coemansia sp. RSA 562]
MVEDILVKIGYLDHYVPELTSSLIKWHVENLQWRKDLKEAALLTDPTNQVPLVLDTQPSPQADRAGPAAPAADAPALPKEPEDPWAIQGHQRTSGCQTDPPAAAPSSPLRLHQVWIKGLVPEHIPSLKGKLFDERFILREIHDITFFPGQVTRFTISPKYYHCFLYQCEAMMWARQERPGQWTKFTSPALPPPDPEKGAPVRGSPIPTGDESNEHSHSGGHEHSRSGGHKHSRDAGDKHSHSESMEHSRGLNELENFHVNFYEADWGSGSSHQREVATGDYHQGDETDDDNSKGE